MLRPKRHPLTKAVREAYKQGYLNGMKRQLKESARKGLFAPLAKFLKGNELVYAYWSGSPVVSNYIYKVFLGQDGHLISLIDDRTQDLITSIKDSDVKEVKDNGTIVCNNGEEVHLFLDKRTPVKRSQLKLNALEQNNV